MREAKFGLQGQLWVSYGETLLALFSVGSCLILVLLDAIITSLVMMCYIIISFYKRIFFRGSAMVALAFASSVNATTP